MCIFVGFCWFHEMSFFGFDAEQIATYNENSEL